MVLYKITYYGDGEVNVVELNVVKETQKCYRLESGGLIRKDVIDYFDGFICYTSNVDRGMECIRNYYIDAINRHKRNIATAEKRIEGLDW